jgi:phosphoenolpyruvate-protein phosphotransferase
MSSENLLAPLTGWSLPLEEVPDPVFAQGLAGQGYAIDPAESVLRSPCAGEVSQIHRCLHALTIRREDGLEVLMHVGIDTVQLQGQGFRPLVKVGDRVLAGQKLLEFDADLIALRCRSLITVIVVPEHPALRSLKGLVGRVESGQSWLDLDLQGVEMQVAQAEGEERTGDWIELPNPSGMHARPAAKLLQLVKPLPGSIWLEGPRGRSSARSLVGILGLGLAPKERVRLVHTQLKPDQVELLEREIRAGLGDDLTAQVTLAPAPAPRAAQPQPAGPDWKGVVASPGVALGKVYLWKRAQYKLPNSSQGAQTEWSHWQNCRTRALEELGQLQSRAPLHEQGIFSAQAELLQDPQLELDTKQLIDQDQPAALAWSQIYQRQAEQLEALPNPLLAARAADVRDVGERLLLALLGQKEARREFPEDCVVVARDLSPSDTVQLDREKVRAICLAQGGPTSHCAILARSLGLPALCAVGSWVLDLAEGQRVVVDAEQGLLLTQPSPEQLELVRQRQAERALQMEKERAAAHQSALTLDGQAIEVAVNIGQLSDLEEGLEMGAEGVGLFRTEFYFHSLQREPDLAEQGQIYSQLASRLGPERRLVARLLDVGGDKPLSYVPMASEENPFLGVRGVRLFARHPELFRRQIEALLEVSGQCKLAIMVPMIANLREWRAIRSVILECAAGRPVELGVMIEVPSAALIAEQLAAEVDFFSIGTNDLTQYTLAIDRAHPDLAADVDSLHPSLLHLMKGVGQAAARRGRWVGVCGGAAQDLDAVPLLLGLGVSELSLSPPAIPSVKAEIRRWSLAQCRELAEQALHCAEAQDVRQLVQSARALLEVRS